METQINSILIPTDFSELSESALKVGIAIAKRHDAKITLIHVVDFFSFLQPTEVFLPDFQIIPDLKFAIEQKLNDFAEKIQIDANVQITTKVLQGSPAESICRFAYNENISLIVMGTHGTSGLREFFIGSEAFKVVKNAQCPVLTIPGNWQKTNFKKVLFPIRLVQGALEKYTLARPIIEMNNSELLLLGLSEKNNLADKVEIVNLVSEFRLQLYMNNVVFQSEICPSNNFAAKVIETGNEYGADLIIITADLDYNVKTFFLGPFAQQIVNHSKQPVLSIKPIIKETDVSERIKQAQNWGKAIEFSDLGLEEALE